MIYIDKSQISLCRNTNNDKLPEDVLSLPRNYISGIEINFETDTDKIVEMINTVVSWL